jgi:hypothetical protein
MIAMKISLALAAFAALILTAFFAGAAHAQTKPAACVGPEYSQLDFWVGEWDLVYPGGGGQNHIGKVMKGCVIEENFNGGPNGLIGHSVSVYQKASGAWRQVWVDDEGSFIDLIGGPVGDKFIFSTVRMPGAGYARMVFENIKPDSLTWRWQKSSDEGKTYKDAWVIQYTRRKDGR